MSESRHDGMSRALTLISLSIVGGALIFGGVSAWLLGPERLAVVFYVLAGSIGAFLVLLGVAFVTRAYRKNDAAPIVRERILDGTRTVIEREKTFDGREQAPLQLPSGAILPPWGVTGGGDVDLLPAPQDPRYGFELPTRRAEDAPPGWDRR